MKNVIPSVLTLLSLVLLPFQGSSQTHFTAVLTGDQENPAVTTDASGTGVFLLTEEGLEFRITVDGLEIANAHFHLGAAGNNGDVVRAIADDFNGNTASGIWTAADDQPLTEELIQDLLLGNVYVNVHTELNGSGEIRGQVLPASGTGFIANLNGDQENPAVTTDAVGTGVFTLTDAGLIYSVTIEGLEATNAHFHLGAAGSNGGIARAIFDDFDNNTALGIWTAADAQPLTEEHITDLLLGNIYVNIHTAANTGGEIRGQVLLSSGIGFTAWLEGGQSVPAIETDAAGTGSFTLTPAGLVYAITIEGLELTNAHFHNAAAGINGGVVRDLFDDFEGNTARGVWKPTDGQSLSEDMIAELLLGNIYVNIHTAAHSGGEIRGQLTLNTGAGFTANLTGAQENPAITSDGTGTGAFMLTDTGLVFSVTIDTSIEIANAHFHLGGTGDNGGIVRAIFDDFDGNTARGVWRPTDTQPLTEEQILNLLAGNLYVNIHTAMHTGGEIRGQVLLSSGTAFSARLTGDQENPAIETAATGTGSFILADSSLVFSVSIDSSLEIANAHFHRGATGANGGIVRAIFDDFTGNTARGVWRPTDAQPLTAELIQDLLAGNLYVNIHTALHSGGEIRGQVLLSAGSGFSAQLMGEQEVPPVTTDASGTGAFTWTGAGLVFNITFTGLEMTNAHFHNAPAGEPGGIVRAILNDFDGNTAFGVWSPDDNQAFTTEQMAELVLGNLYVNVHTAMHGGGEIRGQLGPFDIFTNVEEVDDPLAALAGSSLFQNAPNPFSSDTRIKFHLKQAGHTIMKVYDLMGREITTLVDDRLGTGTYQVSFDASGLTPGMYVYRLEAAGVSEARTMLLK